MFTGNTYKMKTSSKEEYSCTLPSLDDSVDEKDDDEVSSNHEPQNLLAPLFKKSLCFLQYILVMVLTVILNVILIWFKNKFSQLSIKYSESVTKNIHRSFDRIKTFMNVRLVSDFHW